MIGRQLSSVLAVVFVLSLGFASCKTSGSRLNVMGGDLTDDYPMVLQYELYSPTFFNGEDYEKSGCSSVVVSSNTLLTASHCIYEGKWTPEGESSEKAFYYQKASVKVDGKTYVSSKIKWHPLYVRYASNLSEEDEKKGYDYYHRFDIAVIVFDDNPFLNIKPAVLVKSLPSENTSVRLVGFGPNTWDKLEDDQWDWFKGEKSMGVTRVSKNKYCPEGSLEIRTPFDEKKQDLILPSSAPGDSGGPVFIEGSFKLVGIVSGPAGDSENGDTDDVTCYAFPMLQENVKFLKEAQKELGASYNGLD